MIDEIPSDSGASPRGSTVDRRIQLIRLVGACLGLLAAVVFCHRFSSYQMQNFVLGAGVPVSHLPTMCSWFAFHSFWLLLLPPLVLLVGARRLIRERAASTYVEVLLLVTVLLAVVMVLGCILAWQVPYTMPTGEFF
jgi:hypothetical protein